MIECYAVYIDNIYLPKGKIIRKNKIRIKKSDKDKFEFIQSAGELGVVTSTRHYSDQRANNVEHIKNLDLAQEMLISQQCSKTKKWLPLCNFSYAADRGYNLKSKLEKSSVSAKRKNKNYIKHFKIFKMNMNGNLVDSHFTDPISGQRIAFDELATKFSQCDVDIFLHNYDLHHFNCAVVTRLINNLTVTTNQESTYKRNCDPSSILPKGTLSINDIIEMFFVLVIGIKEHSQLHKTFFQRNLNNVTLTDMHNMWNVNNIEVPFYLRSRKNFETCLHFAETLCEVDTKLSYEDFLYYANSNIRKTTPYI